MLRRLARNCELRHSDRHIAKNITNTEHQAYPLNYISLTRATLGSRYSAHDTAFDRVVLSSPSPFPTKLANLRIQYQVQVRRSTISITLC